MMILTMSLKDTQNVSAKALIIFLDWLTQDYKKRLRTNIRVNFDEIKNKK